MARRTRFGVRRPTGRTGSAGRVRSGMSIREDGAAAVDWVARYLERVPELPVLAQVDPGEIRSRLPESAPEEGEPFDAVLRDLDEVLMPGITNWQHPRFFAYFSVTSSEPAMLAELIAAALNQVAILWRWAPPRPPRWIPSRTSRGPAAMRAPGCTWTRRTLAARWSARSCGGRSRESRWRTRS